MLNLERKIIDSQKISEYSFDERINLDRPMIVIVAFNALEITFVRC